MTHRELSAAKSLFGSVAVYKHGWGTLSIAGRREEEVWRNGLDELNLNTLTRSDGWMSWVSVLLNNVDEKHISPSRLLVMTPCSVPRRLQHQSCSCHLRENFTLLTSCSHKRCFQASENVIFYILNFDFGHLEAAKQDVNSQISST